MLDIYYPPRDVTIDNIEREIQRFWPQSEAEVNLYEKVDETGPHVPPNLGLLIHGLGRGHGEELDK